MKSTCSPAVEIGNLTRRFGEVTAVDNVSLTICQGEFFSLLGPSGCGKTTLLRLIAGLDRADAGTIKIGGAHAEDVPAHRRPVNTVFQSYALFPHLNVWDNIAFGLRMKRVPAPEIERRVREVMALVEIDALAQRRPAQLSGGQKQRVALARAVVNEPQVLLLDEPLAALDLKLRKQLQAELVNLQRRLAITFVYVTHDQEEALALSDRLAVMCEGRIEQVGDPQSLYEHPRTRFASQFLGTCSLIEARLKSRATAGVVVDSPLGELHVNMLPPERERVTLAIRPEKVQLRSGPDPGGNNSIRVRVEQVIYAGAETHYQLRAGNALLRAELMNSSADLTEWRRGEEAWVHLPAGALMILDD